MMPHVNMEDFSNDQWMKILNHNYNQKIQNFADAITCMGVEDLRYDAIRKTITCGNHTLQLEDFQTHSLSKEPLKNKNIKRLASFIHMKLTAERTHRVTKNHQQENNLENATLKRPAEQNNDTPPKKKIKLEEKENEHTAIELSKDIFHKHSSITSDQNEQQKPPHDVRLLAPQKMELEVEKTQNIPPLIENKQKELDEALVKAIIENDIDACQNLIKVGANVNYVDEFGVSSFEKAILDLRTDIVDLFLKNNADPNSVDANGTSLLMHSIFNNSVDIFFNLLSHGANINIQDQQGDTALIMAVNLANPLIIDSLLAKEGLKINSTNFYDNTALVLAVNQNDQEIIKKLLEHGADPNIGQNQGRTALIVAIQNNSLPIVELLFKYGANANLTGTEKSPPLVYAIGSEKDLAIFQKLLDNGADINQADEFGLTIYRWIKETRPLNYRKMIDAIKDKSHELKKQNKAIRSRLMVSHAWHIEGTSVISSAEKSVTINLTGANSPIWFHQMNKNLSQFLEKHPNAMREPELLREALINASGTEHTTIERQFESIQKGLCTFVNAGFDEHAVTLLFWKDRLIICDRGGSSTTPIEVYHFDPNALTKDLLTTINEAMSRDEEDYNKLRIELKNLLNLTSTKEDKFLERLGRKNLSMQTVGNCSWTSPMAGIFAFQMLSVLRERKKLPPSERTPQTLKTAIKTNIDGYHAWERFQKIFSLERMLQLMGKIGYNTDVDLIKSVVDEAKRNSDPLLDEQLTLLMQKYEKEIQAEMIESMKIDEPGSLQTP